MRDIRFKAWDKEENKMVYVCELDWFAPIFKGGTTQLWVHNSYSLNEHQSIAGMVGQRYELLQFTGLHDKNGKDIYEGDIVKAVHPADKEGEMDMELAVVVYSAPSFHARYINESLNSFVSGGNGFVLSPHNEVVGTIYENPELLNKP